MFKLLFDNLRELALALAAVAILVLGLLLLGDAGIARSPAASTAVSVLVSLLGGLVKFAVVLAAGWFGLAVTFPEANRFLQSRSFEAWWVKMSDDEKSKLTLLAVAVLVIAASMCMAA